MKRKTAVTILLFLSTGALSQSRTGYISIQAGPSIPVGKYHSTELPSGSFTTTGVAISTEGAWYFREYIGVGGSAGLAMHPVDVRALGYAKVQEDPFLMDLTIRSDPWLIYSAYAGLFGRHGLTGRLSITAKLLGGMVFASTPYQLYKPEYFLVTSKWYEITAAGDYAFSFLAGAGIKYRLNPCIGIYLQGDFTYNGLQFEFLRGDGTVRTEDKRVSFVNTLFGIYFSIGGKAKSLDSAPQ